MKTTHVVDVPLVLDWLAGSLTEDDTAGETMIAEVPNPNVPALDHTRSRHRSATGAPGERSTPTGSLS